MGDYSLKSKINNDAFKKGMKDGVPIGLGYLAVSFSLGIVARNAGLSAFQGFLVSWLCKASAGEYVGFTLIAAGATYLEVAIATFVTNARYILMSCAMSQRTKKDMPLRHRLLLAFDITDELFGAAIARPGFLNPFYSYGAAIVAGLMWAFGTMFGVIAGNLLPAFLVSAFSVALYGMFLAIVIPPARQNKVIAKLVAVSFALSYLFGVLPFIKDIAEGTRTIILTVGISAVAAVLFPRDDESEGEN